jgi:hypothetical protein
MSLRLTSEFPLTLQISWLGELGWMNGKNLDRKVLGPEYDWSDGLPFAGFAVIYAMFGALYVTYTLVCLVRASPVSYRVANHHFPTNSGAHF